MRTVSRLGGGKFERMLIPEMRYVQQDLTQDEFWQHLESKGHAPDCARPDVIHASPPCREHTGLRVLGNGPELEPYTELLQMIIRRLQSYQRERLNLDGVHVPWSVENVQGAKPIFDQFGYPQ
eukprot:337701-Pleurochrysis_carterae.AAC.1